MRKSTLVISALLSALVVFAAEESEKIVRNAKITSDATFYDRKEGVIQLTGNVHVDDEQYQMHADKAYVFLQGTNDLSRIVAIGHVALTNETRRAYGGKVSYYKDNGLVVIYSGDDIKAEVRDEKAEGTQMVRGEKIKFWIDQEQVEVVQAEIEAPAKGAKGVIPGLGGM